MSFGLCAKDKTVLRNNATDTRLLAAGIEAIINRATGVDVTETGVIGPGAIRTGVITPDVIKTKAIKTKAIKTDTK